jgi:hypothetical protein
MIDPVAAKSGRKVAVPLVLVLLLSSAALCEDQGPGGQATEDSVDSAQRILLRGRVLLLPAALEERGIRVAPEMESHVVLRTRQGDLLPILADWRGRAFYQDERLRDRDVELVGLRKTGLPYLQVLSIYTFDDQGRRQYTDYWCDVCSIPMYEIKPCECCQGEIRLRFQDRKLPDFLRPDGAHSLETQRGVPVE